MIILDLFPLSTHEYRSRFPPSEISTLSTDQRDNLRRKIGKSSFEPYDYILNSPHSVGTLNINWRDQAIYYSPTEGDKCVIDSTLSQLFFRADNPDKSTRSMAVRQGNAIRYGGNFWKIRIVYIGDNEVHGYYESQTRHLPYLLRISMVGTVQLPMGSLFYMPPDEEMRSRGMREDLLWWFQNRN
jgi:hypothetical protein